MTTRDYLRVLARRWRVIAALAVLGLAVGAIVTALTPPTYQAQVSLLVSTDATSDQTQANSGNSFAQSRVKSYVAIVTSPDVLSAVDDDLNLGLPQTELERKLTASAATDSLIITITASDGSPSTAAAIANATGRAFASVVQKFETPTGTTQSTVKVLVTSPALAPTTPTSPNGVLNVLLGLLAGLIVGFTVAGLREVLDTALRSPEELAEATGAPLLGAIAADPQTARQPVAAKVSARGPRAEGFRQLRTNLQFVDVDNPPRVIAVNSAVPGEGKTSTAINIAAALAEAGHTVCLVDADLRRPKVAEVMDLAGAVGLTSVLIGSIELDDAFQDVGSNLRVLTSGPLPPNPSELLASNQTRALLRQIAAVVDFVILDTAPLLPVADGAEIAAAADGSILVSRWGVTSLPQVHRSTEALALVDARLLGVVMNRVPIRRAAAYGYTYYGRRPRDAGHRFEAGRAVAIEPTGDTSPDAGEQHPPAAASGSPAALAASAAPAVPTASGSPVPLPVVPAAPERVPTPVPEPAVVAATADVAESAADITEPAAAVGEPAAAAPVSDARRPVAAHRSVSRLRSLATRRRSTVLSAVADPAPEPGDVDPVTEVDAASPVEVAPTNGAPSNEAPSNDAPPNEAPPNDAPPNDAPPADATRRLVALPRETGAARPAAGAVIVNTGNGTARGVAAFAVAQASQRPSAVAVAVAPTGTPVVRVLTVVEATRSRPAAPDVGDPAIAAAASPARATPARMRARPRVEASQEQQPRVS